jgi:hypothetical protein
LYSLLTAHPLMIMPGRQQWLGHFVFSSSSIRRTLAFGAGRHNYSTLSFQSPKGIRAFAFASTAEMSKKGEDVTQQQGGIEGCSKSFCDDDSQF